MSRFLQPLRNDVRAGDGHPHDGRSNDGRSNGGPVGATDDLGTHDLGVSVAVAGSGLPLAEPTAGQAAGIAASAASPEK